MSSDNSVFVRQLTEDDPLDLFIVGLHVFDRPVPRCAIGARRQEAAKFKQESIRRGMGSPSDHFTAYLYGHRYTVELPVEMSCFLRVPEAWEVYINSQQFINGFLDHLIHTIFRRNSTLYRPSIHGTLVWRRHAVGYKPKITTPPTSDSASFLFLHLRCSNPEVYKQLRYKLSSNTTVRQFNKRDFYQRLLTGRGAKYVIVPKHRYGRKCRSNVRPDAASLDSFNGREWFVAHEFTNTVQPNMRVLTDLEITPNGWVRVYSGTVMDTQHRKVAFSHSQFEVCGNVKARGIPLSDIEEKRCGDMTVVALDIECQSDTGAFPSLSNAADPVINVGLVKYNVLSIENKETFCVCLGDTQQRETDDGKTVDTAHTIVCEHETELLNAVCDFINNNDVDIIQTYNGLDFDYTYLDGRAVLAMFVHSFPSFDTFWFHVKQYHKVHMKYLEAFASLKALIADFEEYGLLTKTAFEEQRDELNTTIANILDRKSFGDRTPLPTSTQHAMWGIWPPVSPNAPQNVQKQVAARAQKKALELHEYFTGQPPTHFHYMHKLRAFKGELIIKPTGSKAMGQNCYKYPDLDRVHVDQFTIFKSSQYKLKSLKLNDVAAKYLGVKKYDMPYQELFAGWKSGDPVRRRKNSDYCVQDCDLLRRLDGKHNLTLTLAFLFKMTLTPLIDLSLRGQQIRVFTCLFRQARSIGTVINSRQSHPILVDYQGATVLDPKPGIHGGPKTWVPVLDFKSLYPSIIQAKLLCMMNLVLPNDVNYVLVLEKAGKIPPLLRVKIDENTTYLFSQNAKCIIKRELKRLGDKRSEVKKDMKVMKKRATEFQDQIDDMTVSVLHKRLAALDESIASVTDKLRRCEQDVAVQSAAATSTVPGGESGGGRDGERTTPSQALRTELVRLHTQRTNQCKQLEKLEDLLSKSDEAFMARLAYLKERAAYFTFQHMLCNLLQLSVKMVMNSFYGFFGAQSGMMPGLQPIAISTTFFGRAYIQRTKKFLTNLFATHQDYANLHMDVIYGDTDSVFVKVWPVDTLAEMVEIGQDMGERTTRDEFNYDIILEFEKVANPHVAFEEKKSYIQRVWTDARLDKGYVYISGVVEKRRDNSEFVRALYRMCRQAIIPPIEAGTTKIEFESIDVIENRCAATLAAGLGKLEDDAIPLDDYVITKSLSKPPEAYNEKSRPAHIQLALTIKDRIRKGIMVRRPPISGDRIPYVVCENPDSHKVCDKVEDVDFFKRPTVTKRIDRVYYLKTAKTSITQLYKSIMSVDQLFKASHRVLMAQQNHKRGQRSLQFNQTRDMGARGVHPARMFKSRMCVKRSLKQRSVFGKTATVAPAKKKKKKKKVKKKKEAGVLKPRHLFFAKPGGGGGGGTPHNNEKPR